MPNPIGIMSFNDSGLLLFEMSVAGAVRKVAGNRLAGESSSNIHWL